MPKCFYCENELSWQNDYDSEDYGIETPGVISVYECPACGTSYEVYQLEKECE